MIFFHQVIIFLFALIMLGVTVELIRRRRLRVEYALLWLLTGLVMMIFALVPHVLYALANFLKLHYFSVILLSAFIFLLSIVLHFSTVISRLSDRETILAQRLSLLEQKCDELTDRNVHGNLGDVKQSE